MARKTTIWYEVSDRRYAEMFRKMADTLDQGKAARMHLVNVRIDFPEMTFAYRVVVLCTGSALTLSSTLFSMGEAAPAVGVGFIGIVGLLFTFFRIFQ